MSKSNTTQLLEGFVPAPAGEAQQKHLIRLSKYGKLNQGNPLAGPNKARLDDDGVLDVVAVLDETTKTVAAIMRNFTGETELEGGKTFRNYEVVGLRVFGKDAEAMQAAHDFIEQIRTDQVEEIVGDIPGWI